MTVVSDDDIEQVDLAGGGWSRILISDATTDSPAMTFGHSLFKAETETNPMSHSVDEVALVTSGSGYLGLDDGRVALATGEACHVPAGVWHSVGAGDRDMTMVFGFASSSYPPTERRSDS